jgi:hypothetical protein
MGLHSEIFEQPHAIRHLLKDQLAQVEDVARLMRAIEPPILRAILLGMVTAGQFATADMRSNLIRTLPPFRKNGE